MKAKEIRKNKKVKSRSFVLKIFLVLAVAYAAVSLVELQLQLNNKNTQLEELTQEYNDSLIRTGELQRIIDSDGMEEYAVRVAREKWGYAFPDEEVSRFID